VVVVAGYSWFMARHGLEQGAWATIPFPTPESALRYWVWGGSAVVGLVMTACLVRRGGERRTEARFS